MPTRPELIWGLDGAMAAPAASAAWAEGHTLDAWTLDDRIPGPIPRVTEGETLALTVRNLTAHSRNLHTHGAHHPAQKG